MERKRARFHGSDQVETGGQWGCRVIRLNLEPGSLYLSETSSKGRIIIGGTPRETLSSNFAGEGRNSATLTRLARVLRCPAKCCSITRRIPGWNPISEGRSGSRGDFEENSCWFRETETARRLIQLFFREIFAPFKIRSKVFPFSWLNLRLIGFFFLFSTRNFGFLVPSFVRFLLARVRKFSTSRLNCNFPHVWKRLSLTTGGEILINEIWIIADHVVLCASNVGSLTMEMKRWARYIRRGFARLSRFCCCVRIRWLLN